MAIAALGLMVFVCFYDFKVAYLPYKFGGFISRKALTEQIRNCDVMYLPDGKGNAPRIECYNQLELVNQGAAGSGGKLKWTITGPGSYSLEANLTSPSAVTLPLFWYRGWFKITDSQGNTIQDEPDVKTRWVQFHLPAGASKIKVKLQNTPVQFMGNIFTMITVFILVAFISLVIFMRKANRLSGSGLKAAGVYQGSEQEATPDRQLEDVSAC